jgi:hypothetical protein
LDWKISLNLRRLRCILRKFNYEHIVCNNEKNEIVNRNSSYKNSKIEIEKVLDQRDQFQNLGGDQ